MQPVHLASASRLCPGADSSVRLLPPQRAIDAGSLRIGEGSVTSPALPDLAKVLAAKAPRDMIDVTTVR